MQHLVAALRRTPRGGTQDRQQTYDRFLSALYEWDAKRLSALVTRKPAAKMGARTSTSHVSSVEPALIA
jgi:hypothetical protein